MNGDAKDARSIRFVEISNYNGTADVFGNLVIAN